MISINFSRHALAIATLATLILLNGCVLEVGADDWWDDHDDRHTRHGNQNHHNIAKVFGGIDIDEGESVGKLESVNGGIVLRDNSSADRVETVNGSVRLYDDVEVYSVETVNGSIHGGDNLKVERDLSTVNGGIELRAGTVVKDDVTTVNGTIRLRKTNIGRNVATVNGDIRILRGSIVSGDVVFEENHGMFNNWNKPTLEVDADSVIEGTIHLYRKVNLKIDENADIQDIVEHF